MSKRCPDCGAVNEDARIYCSSCGELLDAELRLIKDLENHKKTAAKPRTESQPDTPQPTAARKSSDEEFEFTRRAKPEQRSSPMPWIILGVIAVVVIAALVILS